jgi:hypothetical protein
VQDAEVTGEVPDCSVRIVGDLDDHLDALAA